MNEPRSNPRPLCIQVIKTPSKNKYPSTIGPAPLGIEPTTNFVIRRTLATWTQLLGFLNSQLRIPGHWGTSKILHVHLISASPRQDRPSSKFSWCHELMKCISTLQEWSNSVHYWWWLVTSPEVKVCWGWYFDVLDPENGLTKEMTKGLTTGLAQAPSSSYLFSHILYFPYPYTPDLEPPRHRAWRVPWLGHTRCV